MRILHSTASLQEENLTFFFLSFHLYLLINTIYLALIQQHPFHSAYFMVLFYSIEFFDGIFHLIFLLYIFIMHFFCLSFLRKGRDYSNARNNYVFLSHQFDYHILTKEKQMTTLIGIVINVMSFLATLQCRSKEVLLFC